MNQLCERKDINGNGKNYVKNNYVEYKKQLRKCYKCRCYGHYAKECKLEQLKDYVEQPSGISQLQQHVKNLTDIIFVNWKAGKIELSEKQISQLLQGVTLAEVRRGISGSEAINQTVNELIAQYELDQKRTEKKRKSKWDYLDELNDWNRWKIVKQDSQESNISSKSTSAQSKELCENMVQKPANAEVIVSKIPKCLRTFEDEKAELNKKEINDDESPLQEKIRNEEQQKFEKKLQEEEQLKQDILEIAQDDQKFAEEKCQELGTSLEVLSQSVKQETPEQIHKCEMSNDEIIKELKEIAPYDKQYVIQTCKDYNIDIKTVISDYEEEQQQDYGLDKVQITTPEQQQIIDKTKQVAQRKEEIVNKHAQAIKVFTQFKQKQSQLTFELNVAKETKNTVISAQILGKLATLQSMLYNKQQELLKLEKQAKLCDEEIDELQRQFDETCR
jgi:hypothetical protein